MQWHHDHLRLLRWFHRLRPTPEGLTQVGDYHVLRAAWLMQGSSRGSTGAEKATPAPSINGHPRRQLWSANKLFSATSSPAHDALTCREDGAVEVDVPGLLVDHRTHRGEGLTQARQAWGASLTEPGHQAGGGRRSCRRGRHDEQRTGGAGDKGCGCRSIGDRSEGPMGKSNVTFSP